jgi:23S rRNA (cytosine1962-C5)-methyltransferase
MLDPRQYELLDFGHHRRLERFGDYVISRPCPSAAQASRRRGSLWQHAHARFERTTPDLGVWKYSQKMPTTWTVSYQRCTFELRCSDHGQVGLFAEQADNWDWIAHQVQRESSTLRVLNLFAYTGASTLAAAAAGAEVVHVDGARSAVSWARRNAVHSGLTDAAIRWIVEDAGKFVRRELRRGNRYHAVILDPPSYGHGPKGEIWRLGKDLRRLLLACGQLTAPRRAFVLMTCHTPGYGPAELSACMSDALFGGGKTSVVARPLYLSTVDGRRLSAGVMARWPG